MADTQKAITHLQIVHTWAEFALEKDINFFNEKHMKSMIEWTNDAVELLKHQNGLAKALKQMTATNEYLNKEIESLKAKPIEICENYQGLSACPKCGNVIEHSICEGMHVRFCRYCGQEITWWEP